MASLSVCFIFCLLFDVGNTYNPFLLQKRIRTNCHSTAQSHITFERSLNNRNFVKFICGASNQDVPLIRNLCLIYTLAGVDCIDVSADNAVINAAIEGIEAAHFILKDQNIYRDSSGPCLMISVNDDEDPHFRKASFDPERCPITCPRPCERVCPAWAIPPPSSELFNSSSGVINERCYGCGRCVPVCPLGLIQTVPYTTDRNSIRQFMSSGPAQAIEIHIQPNHVNNFRSLWLDIGHDVLSHAKIIAVSFPDMGNNTIPYLLSLQNIIQTHPSWDLFTGVQIWQADGRPMSGDIGKGTARAAVALAQRVLQDASKTSIAHVSNDVNEEFLKENLEHKFPIGQGKHFVQLAGGTNDYSSMIAKETGLQHMNGFGGYAFGGFARKQISDILREYDHDENKLLRIEDHKILLTKCLDIANSLVMSVKSSSSSSL
eukprot:gene8515-17556_t